MLFCSSYSHCWNLKGAHVGIYRRGKPIRPSEQQVHIIDGNYHRATQALVKKGEKKKDQRIHPEMCRSPDVNLRSEDKESEIVAENA